MKSHIARKLAQRYLQRRATAGPASAAKRAAARRPSITTGAGSADPSPGRQGTCPVCGRSGRLLRTQILGADGERVDWICVGCRG